MGIGSSKTITRKPSMKLGRRFSLKRRSSIREPPFRPRYTQRVDSATRSITTDDTQPQPRAKPREEPKVEPRVEPNEESRVEPKEEASAEPKAEPKVQPKEEPRAEPKAEPKEEPRAQPKAEPQAEPKDIPKEEPNVESRIEFRIEPYIEPESRPEIKTEPHFEPEVEPRSMPRPKPKAIEKVVETNMDFFIEHSTRRRSLSDGQLPVSLQHLRDAQGQGCAHSHDPVQDPGQDHGQIALRARDLSHVVRVGYLKRRVGSDWYSAWYVLKDNTLYQYAQPIDDVTQDVIQLVGYEVIPCLPVGEGYTFQLMHPSGASHALSTDNMADCELWMEQIHIASQKLTLDSLSLDTTNSFEQQEATMTRKQLEEEVRHQWQHELLRLKKQQLLLEVLQQKEELTRRQGMLGKTKQPSSFEGSPPTVRQRMTSIPLRLMISYCGTVPSSNSERFQCSSGRTWYRSSSSRPTAAANPKRKRKFGWRRADKPTLASSRLDPEQLELELRKLNAELERLSVQLKQAERQSGSSGYLSGSAVNATKRKRTDFALGSSASTDSSASCPRDRTQSDFSETRLNRSFASDPSLLVSPPCCSRLSMRFDSVFGPDAGTNLDCAHVGGSRVQLSPIAGQDVGAEIPMMDQEPSPECHPVGSCQSRHSWDTSSTALPFHHSATRACHGSAEGDQYTMTTAVASLNKSCDFSLLQGKHQNEAAYRGHMYSSTSGGHGDREQQRTSTIPRCYSESSNMSKCEISASALAEIAAFEELVHKKMHHSTVLQ